MAVKRVTLILVAVAAFLALGQAHPHHHPPRGGPPRRGPHRGCPPPGGPPNGGPPNGGPPNGGPPHGGPPPGGPPHGGPPHGRPPHGRPPHGGPPGGPPDCPPDQGSGGPPPDGSGRPPVPGGDKDSVTAPEDVVATATLQANEGTCNGQGYTCNKNTCGTGITPVFKEIIDGDWRILITNGIPNHNYSIGAEQPNPNAVCIHNSYMKIPVSPTKGDFTASGLGPVGIALSGGYLYNHLGNPEGGVAVISEAATFDSCSGHADPLCKYHYHKVPNCLDPNNSCKLVGYMKDGFPVYSFCDIDGVRLRSCYRLISGNDGSNQDHYEYVANSDCHLDVANGYEFGDARGYGYVFSENYPFVMRGFMGSTLYDICEVY